MIQPPTDSKAEAFALLHLCMDSARIADVNLAPLLVCWEHRAIWEGMVRVHMRRPGLPPGEFMVALRRDLHIVECPKPAALLSKRSHTAGIPGCEGQRFTSLLIGVALDELGRPLDFWLARLERVKEARRLLAQAQTMAEQAWRGDVEGARATVADAARTVRAPLESRLLRV